ncbi:MAG TPA: trigger factor [Actinomycetota bacterium]|nr:trigger factor [Actinomycetota bacterium]
MKTTVERESPTKVKLLVEVEPMEVERLTAETIQRLAKDIKIPGFRKGKVPRQIIESRMGKDAIRQRMLEESMPRLYTDATRQESLRPVSSPDIEVVDFDGDAFSFTASVEVRPDIKLPLYLGLEVQRPSNQATRAEIDDRLAVLQKRFATLEPVGRNAEKGDFVLIDIRASIHDTTIDEASANDLMYEVGTGTLTPETDDELVGKRAGDIIKFNSVLPERLSPEHGGKEVTMTVIVKEVSQRRMPPLDDDFAKTASEFDTLEELEGEIRDRIEEYKGVQADREVSNRLLDELVDITDVTVPESLISAEAEARMTALEEEVRKHGMTVHDYLETVNMTQLELSTSQRRAAERSIAADFVLDEIAKAEGLNVTRAELDAEIDKIATRAGRDVDEFRRDVDKSGRVEALAGDILRRKVLNYLVEHAEITDETNEEPASGPPAD